MILYLYMGIFQWPLKKLARLFLWCLVEKDSSTAMMPLLILTVESAKEAILSVLCVRKPHLAHDDDGGNVHKLNETKKLNQAMVALSR